jgi:hypothetical protein
MKFGEFSDINVKEKVLNLAFTHLLNLASTTKPIQHCIGLVVEAKFNRKQLALGTSSGAKLDRGSISRMMLSAFFVCR